MREFDDYGLRICRFQAVLFSDSAEKAECSSPVFLRRFMYSKVAKRMDGEGFLMEAIAPEDVFDEINAEFGESSYGKTKYDKEELYWMGYIYRYWCYTEDISTKRVYRMFKPDKLRELYYPYHSLDPAQAIERIKEAAGISEEDYIRKGVMLLREMNAKYGSGSKTQPLNNLPGKNPDQKAGHDAGDNENGSVK